MNFFSDAILRPVAPPLQPWLVLVQEQCAEELLARDVMNSLQLRLCCSDEKQSRCKRGSRSFVSKFRFVGIFGECICHHNSCDYD